MRNNLGTTDRLVRFIPGAVLLIIVLASNLTSGILSYILLIAGVILVLTGIIGVCPLYRLLGINTCPKTNN